VVGPVEIEWSLDALADIDRFAAFLHERFPDLRRRSICRSHSFSWFQLAKMRLTT